MSTIESIKNNSITNLDLSYEDEDVIDNCIEAASALEKNTSILTIRFGNEFLGCLRNDNRSDILKAVAKMQNLQELHLEDGLILIGDVAEVVLNAKGLKVLTLGNIVLQGIQSDFDAMEVALYQHPSLKEFHLDKCRPAIDTISTDNLKLATAKKSGLSPSGRSSVNPAAA